MAVLTDSRVIPPIISAMYAADQDKPVAHCKPTLMRKVGKARAGRMLDDAEWNEVPTALIGEVTECQP